MSLPLVLRDSVKGMDYVTLEELKIIQGDLKSLSKSAYERFKNQLLEVGFASPFHFWINEKGHKDILDGTTRKKVLMMMREEGISLPEKFPAVRIDAPDLKTAKKILLGLASTYAKMTDESLSDFAIESEIDLDWIKTNIELPFTSGIDVGDINFEAGTEEEQGKLDEKAKVTCPECGHEF